MTDEHPAADALATGGSPSDASDRELFEARITAHALGQLDAAEAAEIERLLADPARSDARQQMAEVRRLAAAIRSALDEAGPARSGDLRRTVLAAATTVAVPNIVSGSPQPAPPWRARRLLAVGGGLAASLVIAATLFIGRSADRMVAMHDGATRKAIEQPVAADEAQAKGTKPQHAAGKAAAFRMADKAKEAAIENGDADKSARAVPAASVPPPAPMKDMADRVAAAPNPAAAVLKEAGRARRLAAEAARDETPARTPAFGQDAAAIDVFTVREIPAGGEGYATVTENRPVSPREQPLSTFSIDVDTASYANVRRFLAAGRLPPRDAVRIEELVNYFRYDYPQPEAAVPFSVNVHATECPWKPGHRLVRIGLQGRDIDRRQRPAGNLVFLVDVSGSMQAPNKLPLVKQALALLVDELSENDRVAIVTYAGNAGLALPPTTGDQKGKIRAAIEALEAGGSTHGSAGIELAYEQAREHFIPGGANRVILATDGDLNVGVTSTAALIDLIKEKAKAGVFLTVLGFGEGNLQDQKMEALADNGNGVYAYIDGAREARKVLVEQLTGSTVTIAKDVKIQVEFNPAQVASYRLIGYENRVLASRDFRDDSKDAGEIGAGHSMTALYEIVLVGEENGSEGVEPLKYQPRLELEAERTEPDVDPAVRRELLTVKLRWKRPDAEESTGIEVALADRGPEFQQAPADVRFAAAVAAFGMILRGSDQRGEATLPLVAKIASGALGHDDGGYRAEFLDLVRRAESAR